MTQVTMTVNGNAVSDDVEGRTLLSEFLRERLRLTGTHVGCDTSQCGACVVHVNGAAIKSCTALAADLDGAEVVTNEGMADRGRGGQGMHVLGKMTGQRDAPRPPGPQGGVTGNVARGRRPCRGIMVSAQDPSAAKTRRVRPGRALAPMP